MERNVTQNIENINNRVNNLLVQNQPTEGNSELIDIRTGADGKTYPTAGEAVRAIGKGTGLVDKGVKSRSLKSVYADKITFNMLSMLEMVTTGQAVAQITDSEVLLTNSGNTVQFGVRFNNITPDLFDEKFQFTVDYESDLDHVNWYITVDKGDKGDNKASWAPIGNNVSGNGSKLRTFDRSHMEYAVSVYNNIFGTSETIDTVPSWSVYICVPFIKNVPDFNYDGYFKISNILVTSDRNLNKSESEIGEVKKKMYYI